MVRSIRLWILILLLHVLSLLAQEVSKTIFATGTQYIIGMSPEAAYDLAIAEALSNAKESVGIKVTKYSMVLNEELNTSEYREIFKKYIKTQPQGKILNFTVLDSIIEKDDIGKLFWKVYIKATVAIDNGEPQFDLVANFLDYRTHYNDEDNIYLEITSSRDCYLYIFHIFDIYKAKIWLPDEKWFQTNFVKSGTTRKVPDWNEVPIQITITEGRDIEIDHLLIVALAADKNPGFADKRRPDSKSYYETDLFKINKWLLKFNKNIDKAELYLPFVIHSKSDKLLIEH